MRVILEMIQIQTKPMTNTHCNTETVQDEILSEYLNKSLDQAASPNMEEMTEK